MTAFSIPEKMFLKIERLMCAFNTMGVILYTVYKQCSLSLKRVHKKNK